MKQQMMDNAPAVQKWSKNVARLGSWVLWTVVAAWAAPYALAGVIAAALCGDIDSFRQLVSGMAAVDAHSWHSMAMDGSEARLIIRAFVVLLSIWILTGRKISTGVGTLGTAANDRIARLPVMVRIANAWNRIARKEIPYEVSFVSSALIAALFLVVATHPVEHVHPPFSQKPTKASPSAGAAITLSDGRIISGAADVHQDAQGNYVVSFSRRDPEPDTHR
ncbi:hypothetical protein [Burkholderia gladioli]|uniref:hypothetical protein n=1 Tax=Burkholderia gladioli TaxID=28095 RepID=UPI00163E278E|nr:hypothetical protein [Burkholderia gladioli]